MRWSPQQEQIFDAFANKKGHVAVIARAGTGKTTTCKEGVTRAPEEKKVYVCFNKRNVEEAKKKIKDPKCQIMSLNGMGYRYVLTQWKGAKPDDSVERERTERAAARLGFKDRLTASAKADILKLVGMAKNTCPFADMQQLERVAENYGIWPSEVDAEGEEWTTHDYARVAHLAMELAKTRDAQNRISFNDQIWLPIVMRWVRPWWQLVVVDECQDMNATQLLLVRQACSPKGRIVLIGDPRQAIYAFRGAAVGGMERLIQELGATTYPLTVTYRCGREIVEMAKALVPDYEAAPDAPSGEIVTTSKLDPKPGDAVLSRTNAPLVSECLRLLKAGTPAKIEGRSIGDELIRIVEKFKAKSVSDLLVKAKKWHEKQCSRISAGKGTEESRTRAIENVTDQYDCIRVIAEVSASVSDAINRMKALFEDSDGRPKPCVHLSTVHKAKGLEWDKVWLMENTFRKTRTTAESEEANIRYVAITRAKSKLYLFDPAQAEAETAAPTQ